MSEIKRTGGRAFPFPWQCTECGEKQIFPLATDYITSVRHEGRSYEIRIPDLEIPTCRKCGNQVFSSKQDDQIVAALRAKLCLLIPEEIRTRRKRHEPNQEKFA